MKKIDVSVIIVNYHVEKELLDCIASIKQSKPRVSYEIIMVDNDEKKTLKSSLSKKFPECIYIPTTQNVGFGEGNNIGARKAKGEFLYFLNPDTLLLSDALDISVDFYKTHPEAGLVASHLYDKNKKAYERQGSLEMTPFRAGVVYSFINKHFPKNPISSSYFYSKIKKNRPFSVEIPPLSATLIPAKLFKQAGMFDPKIFLYFEEYDLGRRVRRLGFTNYILPEAKVLHLWERSTSKRNDRNKILEQSRQYYLRKYYGKVRTRLVEAFLHRDLRYLMVE